MCWIVRGLEGAVVGALKPFWCPSLAAVCVHASTPYVEDLTQLLFPLAFPAPVDLEVNPITLALKAVVFQLSCAVCHCVAARNAEAASGRQLTSYRVPQVPPVMRSDAAARSLSCFAPSSYCCCSAVLFTKAPCVTCLRQ